MSATEQAKKTPKKRPKVKKPPAEPTAAKGLTKKPDKTDSQMLNELRQDMDDMQFNGHLEELSYAFEDKSLDSSAASQSLIHFPSIEEDIDKTELQRLYMTEGWFYIAVSTIAQTIAGLPIIIEREITTTEQVDLPNGQKESVQTSTWVEANGEPENKLFQFPNDINTRTEFLQLLLVDLLATGDFYAFLDRSTEVGFATNETIQAMYRLNAALVEPIPDSEGKYVRAYGMQTPYGYFEFLPEEIVHVRMPNPADPYFGLAPIVPVLKNLILDRFITEHKIRFYKKGARLGGVIQTTKNLNKQQLTRLQRSFDNNYTGRSNHHKTMILPNGMEYHIIQAKEDTGITDTIKINRELILSAYKLPPIKAGILDGASYANALLQDKTFWANIKPIITMVEEGMNKDERLLPEDRKLRMRFDLSEVESLQEDLKEKATTGKEMIASGLTVNEVRKRVWKSPAIDGGDVTSAIKPETPFRQFSAQSQDAEKEAETTRPVALSGSQAQSIKDIVMSIAKREIPREAGIRMLSAAFQLDQATAEGIVGEAGRGFTIGEVEDKTKIVPDKQNDTEGRTDIMPTTASFDERLAELVGIGITDGLSPQGAVAWALERARQEGLDEAQTEPETQEEPEEGKVNRIEGESVDECVARAIPILIGEGMSQEQAVAAAHSMCEAPEKQEEVSNPEIRPVGVGGAVIDCPDDFETEEEDDEEKAGQADPNREDPKDGAHIHEYLPSASSTEFDGEHRHLYRLPSGRMVETQEDGAHRHDITLENPERSGQHTHTIVIDGTKYTTGSDDGHIHRFGEAATPMGGSHFHALKFGDDDLRSLTEADRRNTEESDDPDKYDDGKSSEEDKKVKPGLSKEVLQDHWKQMVGNDTVEEMMTDRWDSAKAYFKELEELFIRQLRRNLKKRGLLFQAKQDDDFINPNELRSAQLTAEQKAVQDAQKASRWGYEKSLIEVQIDFPDKEAREILEKVAAENVQNVTDTTRKALRGIISEGQEKNETIAEISKSIRDYFGRLTGDEQNTRSVTIARHETLAAISQGQELKNDQFRAEFPDDAKRLMKAWISPGDPPRARDDHIELDEAGPIPADEKFANGLDFPRDPGGAPEDVINCRCSWITFLSEDESQITSILDQSSPLADILPG